MASAVVYKWVDAKGNVQYGDEPPDGVQAEVVDLLGTHTSRATSTRTSDTAPAKAALQPNQDDAIAKKAVQDDVAQAKEKECADAQERYKKLIDGRHIYKTGADGERQYLTSDEIDSERLNAKKEVDTACNSST